MPETILILAANPENQHPLRLETEVREIQNGLRHSKRKFKIQQHWGVRPEDLRRALLDIRPKYVHFCGHGGGSKGIALQNQLITAPALAGLFELFSDSIECVVLNACYSSVQAKSISRHINFVIGMKDRISDNAAIEFSVAFYDALAAGRQVDFAYRLARNAIQVLGLPQDLVPTLHQKPQPIKKKTRRDCQQAEESLKPTGTVPRT